VSDKSIEEEIKLKAQKSRKLARYMSSTQDLVENQIRKAMENGEFDNLAGTRLSSIQSNSFKSTSGNI
jgi:DnaJ family protein C protein 28